MFSIEVGITLSIYNLLQNLFYLYNIAYTERLNKTMVTYSNIHFTTLVELLKWYYLSVYFHIVFFL